jgi:hypothetical protein
LRRLLPYLRVAAAAAATALVVVVVSAIAGGDSDSDRPLPPAPSPQGLPPGFIGIVTEDAFAGDADYRSDALTRQRELGVGLIRQTFDWAQIEHVEGVYDFTAYDAFVGDAARKGLRVLPLLFNPPPFHSSAPASGVRRGVYPPRRPGDMAAFATALVRRYGPGGRFWAANRDLRPLPIRAWQVWNEPSLPAYWASGPNPREYAQLLAVTSAAIKRQDPTAEVVTAGIPQSRLGVPFTSFVTGMYRAGARRYFDALAIHPYARTAADVVEAVTGARRLLDRLGDRDARLWATELGWATDGPSSPFTVGEEGQAERIREVIPALARRQEELGLRGIVYFNWRDGAPYEGGTDFFGLHTGLLDEQGDPKPGLGAFEDAVRSLGR